MNIKQDDYVVATGGIEGVIKRVFSDGTNAIIRDYQHNEYKIALKNCVAVNKFKRSIKGDQESFYSRTIVDELLKRFKFEGFNDILRDYEEIKNHINCLHNSGVIEISFQWVLLCAKRGYTYLRANESMAELISYSGGLNSIDGRAEIKIVYDDYIEIIFNGGEL